MKNLLKVELRCLLRQKSTYICILIVIALVSLPILLYGSDDVEHLESIGMNLFHSSFSGSFIDILLPILIAMIVCRDFTSESIRLIVGRGYSRAQIYCSKWIAALVLIMVLALTCWITAYVSLAAFLNYTVTFSLHLLLVLLTQLLVAAALSSVAFCIAFIARKSSAAITAGILCPSLGSIAVSMIEIFLEIESGKVSGCWIWTCFANLTGDVISNETLCFSLIVSVIWLAVFQSIGFVHFKKADV